MNVHIKRVLRTSVLLLFALASLFASSPHITYAGSGDHSEVTEAQGALGKDALAQDAFPEQAASAGKSIFRNPVVPGVPVSGYFDHSNESGIVVFYDGRRNAAGAGFYFSCNESQAPMYDWVGCLDNVTGEPACANERELWYDGHHGIDYEFSWDWHTGARCDLSRFSGLTRPIYAPAAGLVDYVQVNPPHQFNGRFIRIKHDVNGNGNYNDDNLRSYYLHFESVAVSIGQIVQEGQFLGMGGSTGYSSTPHLHFEVQRSNDNFTYTAWPVDPFGWSGPGTDPYPYLNERLWQVPAQGPLEPVLYIPFVSSMQVEPVNLIQNAGFEEGDDAHWHYTGPQIIVRRGTPNLTVAPAEGDWLAWLGDRTFVTDTLWQDFTVPNDISGAVFNYALWVRTSSPEDDDDVMEINLQTLSGEQIQQIDVVRPDFNAPNRWVHLTRAVVDLSPYAGQTLRLRFDVTAGGEPKTGFFIDNVRLVTYR